MKENPNENCLAGMECPECGNFDVFDIMVKQERYVKVTDDGTDSFAFEGDIEWDGHSACRCVACGHEATVAEFRGEEAKTVVYRGYLGLPGMERVEFDFDCKPNATKKELDAAYVKALTQIAEVNYLAIGEA